MQDHDLSASIAAAHRAEVDLARTEIRKAVANAGKAWISQDAINDALFLEFIERATKCTSSTELAAQLSNVAAKLTSATKRTH